MSHRSLHTIFAPRHATVRRHQHLHAALGASGTNIGEHALHNHRAVKDSMLAPISHEDYKGPVTCRAWMNNTLQTTQCTTPYILNESLVRLTHNSRIVMVRSCELTKVFAANERNKRSARAIGPSEKHFCAVHHDTSQKFLEPNAKADCSA